ncbi:MAG TPA: UDP-N-acetylmuramate--L-alanine ligase, partial [Gemmatimonadaceae bacterium]|nr:UDP-N-acetylmuramate--L-alanine ligase [Gemmatimonadaceae bacterium]
RLGLTLYEGHDQSHVAGTRAVVVTSAVPKTHPELERARSLGIPVIRRAEALGEAVSEATLVAVAGTHGKTTTTVLTTEALRAGGLDPTGVVGGRVSAWGGNLSEGGNSLFVVEADEYDRSFLALTPTIAIVTNVEADHLDIYLDLAEIRETFAKFVQPARTIILCADDDGANTLPTPSSAEVIRYGIRSDDARVRARNVELRGEGSELDVEYDGEPLGHVSLKVPGRHNVLNGLAGVSAGLALGLSVERMRNGLAAFGGVERRFERLGDARGISVVDDYAHNPTKVRAALETARVAFPGRRIVAAFQPHLFTRTRDFAKEFGEALATADAVFLTEIYPAREQPIAGVTSSLIERAVRDAGGTMAWRGDRAALAEALGSSVREGDVVITIGAGDITKTGPELLQRLGRG